MECPLGTFGYQDFRPLTFVVLELIRTSKHYRIPIGISLDH
jgi:hypothetical protein